jgi:phospholipid/cholesterol/gamma-HCH transport system permease protein
VGDEIIELVSFFGETLAVLTRQVLNPRRIRWVSVVHTMEVAGLNAMPIIALLSFFIGLVVAYLGARILGDFGASVFTVELVAFSVMREFAVVITAVLLAGRTDSAFTAEIGAMKMRQEIDAMRVMEIDPMEALVVPRVMAMVVMMPILTFIAMMAGLFGGVLVCWAELDVSPAMFFTRISELVPAQHFWVGMSKSPVFALVLAVIGCKQGLSVGGDVASLGRCVTTSVVQSIFMVILLDAGFALWFLEMDL